MKLHIDNNISFQELKDKIEQGGKFIAYQYIISVPLFLPTRRFSKLFFIDNGEKLSKYALASNILNIILGLWGLPFGPPIMVKTIVSNCKGGIDFTDDVMVNLTEDSFSKKEVSMEISSKYFLEPSKSNKKEFKKVLLKLRSKNIVDEMIIGLYINTEDEKPYHVIGVFVDLDSTKEQHIMDEIYKKFFKRMKFKLVSFKEESYEHLERLKDEGCKIE